MAAALKRISTIVALSVALAGCNEFSVNCSTPKGNYLLMVKPGSPWLPMIAPAVRWVTPADIYDLTVLRADEYQVRAELRTRIAGWPSEAQRQTFVVNRITSEFQTAFKGKQTTDPGGSSSESVAAETPTEAIGGTCSRVFPQRL